MGGMKKMWSALLDILEESLQPQGTRGLYLRRATSRDLALGLELQLNVCMLCELFVQMLAAGLGTLALVWATVVLLGGFSASLEGADFWVITAIVFIQTARVVGLNLSPEAKIFNQVPPAFLELGRRRLETGHGAGKQILYYLKNFAIIMALLAVLVLAVPLVAALCCISLSIYRLVSLLSTHHQHSNVFRSLMLFYALVLLQGGLFIISLCIWLFRNFLSYRLRYRYGLNMSNSRLVFKYMDVTLSTAIKNGVSSTINRNLVSFAADMIESDYSEDNIDAVLVMHALTSQEDHRTRTLSQIQSSPLCVSRLLDMVTSKSQDDQRIKLCIAEILAHLASNLRLTDISGATQSISSMLDSYFMKMSTPATSVNIGHHTTIDITTDQQGAIQSASTTNGTESTGLCISIKKLIKATMIRHRQQGALRFSSTIGGSESKPLIIHGMLILAKLAVNPVNCKQIYDSKGLFSKIISPVKNKVYEIPSDDGITMEITEKALEVVSTLVSGTDETNGKIRRDICISRIAVNDFCPILERDHMYNKLKVPAIKILTKLYLHMSTGDTVGLDDIVKFIKVLMNIFFDAVNESGLRKTALRKTAGKALAVLALDNANCTTIMNFSTGTETSVVQLLTTMILKANNKLYRPAIAQLLTQFFANSDSNAERKGLESAKTILHEVLKVICNVKQEANADPAGSPQHNLGQQEAANANQIGQHNPGRMHSRALHRLISLLRTHHSRAANRNASSDNLMVIDQLVGTRRKSLAAFLGLGLQIFDKLEVTADDLDTALARIPLSMGEFVDKLNYIIEHCSGHSFDSLEGKRPAVDYLIIFKTVTKLCTWLMQSKPDCITEFRSKDTSTKLQGALEDMKDLELGMILSGSLGDMAHYQTLSTIVSAAQQKMNPRVPGRSG